MHKMTFFPLGNADCCRIDLACSKKILFDFADTRDPEDENDLRCDLPKELREDLEACNRDYFDVVAFSRLDKDHFCGATEFFYLEHAKKYQGEDRIKMNVMWVPAALITEQGPDDDEARILQKEARHRFREGKGIRVFSRPERLRRWCEENGIKLDDRLGIITDAGELVPDFSLSTDKVEFFVHSPFAMRQDEKTVEDRWYAYIWETGAILWAVVSTAIALGALAMAILLPAYVRKRAHYYAESFFGAVIALSASGNPKK